MRDCGCELTKCNCSLAKCTPELAGTTKVCGSDNFQVPNSCYGCALNCGNRHYKYSTDYTLHLPQRRYLHSSLKRWHNFPPGRPIKWIKGKNPLERRNFNLPFFVISVREFACCTNV
ncbi:hypothetical protein BV898_09282 [Hypsibius exemplaris]|uniref:Uncharacterized protein n=1 Tax=Hypsibius exemplaris TaxID=2072580 RepID=A0A1W0WN59_HYPEX|nr:hypothetical protein BV898_09282 [Hypsibius exemplaris]